MSNLQVLRFDHRPKAGSFTPDLQGETWFIHGVFGPRITKSGEWEVHCGPDESIREEYKLEVAETPIF